MTEREYLVIALYDLPPLEREAIVNATSKKQAIVKAILEKKLPARFAPDADGWYEAQFWHPDMARGQRWPILLSESTLSWGDGGDSNELEFLVKELAAVNSHLLRI